MKREPNPPAADHQPPAPVADRHDLGGKMLQVYTGYVPPCGIFCGGCPVYKRPRNGCAGAETRCKVRRCKGLYVCCVEKRGLRFCHECPIYPCARFRRFAAHWLKNGQCNFDNQSRLKARGPKKMADGMERKGGLLSGENKVMNNPKWPERHGPNHHAGRGPPVAPAAVVAHF